MTLTVTVLMGGNSHEAEVSRTSASQVAKALQANGMQAHTLEIDTGFIPTLLDDPPDVVFPALHGPPGEDGTIQGALEMLGLPYVGSDVRGCALAMDKAVAKGIFNSHHLPTLPDLIVQPDSDLDAVVADIVAQFGSRIVVKPLNQGSAIGVTPLPNGGDVEEALTAALTYGPCLVEPFCLGREITVGVLERAGVLVPHPVIEIRTRENEWYDYTNRYQAGKSEHIIPAPLAAQLCEQLQQIAVQAHRALGLRDLSRADFIVTDEAQPQIALLEVNALPGMTPTSLYPDGASHLGYSFPDLVELLVRQAYARAHR